MITYLKVNPQVRPPKEDIHGPGYPVPKYDARRGEVVVPAFEIVEAFGAAWANHDLEVALSFLSEDCVFDGTGPAPDGTRHVGQEQIRRAWKAIFDDGSSQFEAEETFAAGDRVVQRWRYSWDGGHVRGVDLFKVTNDKIAEKLSYVKG
jgi:ketosteroid isomerase-like protein